jgi:hypothetical protein
MLKLSLFRVETVAGPHPGGVFIRRRHDLRPSFDRSLPEQRRP